MLEETYSGPIDKNLSDPSGENHPIEVNEGFSNEKYLTGDPQEPTMKGRGEIFPSRENRSALKA